MSSDADLDLFDHEVLVEPTSTSNPRVVQVVGALVAGALLVAITVVTVVSGLSAVLPRTGPCGGASSCSDLSLDQLRSLTALEFEDGAEVVESRYSEADGQATMTARVLLPMGGGDPFLASAYFVIDSPKLDWPVDDLYVLDYYAATGDSASFEAEAVYAIDDDARELVLVHVTRAVE